MAPVRKVQEGMDLASRLVRLEGAEEGAGVLLLPLSAHAMERCRQSAVSRTMQKAMKSQAELISRRCFYDVLCFAEIVLLTE